MGGKKKSKNEAHNFYSTETIDGVTLWMKRYKPMNGTVSSIPVILCHGLLANKHSLDFGDKDEDKTLWDQYSLASFLFDESSNNSVSFDVWVPELRGRRSYSEYDFAKRGQVPESKHWGFDDYADKDVPAIIDKIKKVYATEGKPNTQVFWVGMSMGGMLAYAHGQTEQGHRDLKGVVTIGSPATFEYSKSFFAKFKGIAPRNMFLRINLRSFLENNPKFKTIFLENAIETGNTTKDIAELYLEMGFDNSISSKILSHFGLFFRHHNFFWYPKCPWWYDFLDKIPLLRNCVSPPSWKENLDLFQTPLLAIAGGGDEEAPPKEVKNGISRIGSSEITYQEFSKQSEVEKDFSHLDFHLSKLAKKEVYPVICDWLINQQDE